MTKILVVDDEIDVCDFVKHFFEERNFRTFTALSGKEALILEVPKDPNKTHPYRQTEVVALVNQKCGGTPPFNSHDFQCIKKVYKITSKAELCYLPKFSSPQYSEKLVNWIVKQAVKNPDFFVRTRSKAKRK